MPVGSMPAPLLREARVRGVGDFGAEVAPVVVAVARWCRRCRGRRRWCRCGLGDGDGLRGVAGEDQRAAGGGDGGVGSGGGQSPALRMLTTSPTVAATERSTETVVAPTVTLTGPVVMPLSVAPLRSAEAGVGGEGGAEGLIADDLRRMFRRRRRLRLTVYWRLAPVGVRIPWPCSVPDVLVAAVEGDEGIDGAGLSAEDGLALVLGVGEVFELGEHGVDDLGLGGAGRRWRWSRPGVGDGLWRW